MDLVWCEYRWPFWQWEEPDPVGADGLPEGWEYGPDGPMPIPSSSSSPAPEPEPSPGGSPGPSPGPSSEGPSVSSSLAPCPADCSDCQPTLFVYIPPDSPVHAGCYPVWRVGESCEWQRNEGSFDITLYCDSERCRWTVRLRDYENRYVCWWQHPTPVHECPWLDDYPFRTSWSESGTAPCQAPCPSVRVSSIPCPLSDDLCGTCADRYCVEIDGVTCADDPLHDADPNGLYTVSRLDVDEDICFWESVPTNERPYRVQLFRLFSYWAILLTGPGVPHCFWYRPNDEPSGGSSSPGPTDLCPPTGLDWWSPVLDQDECCGSARVLHDGGCGTGGPSSPGAASSAGTSSPGAASSPAASSPAPAADCCYDCYWVYDTGSPPGTVQLDCDGGGVCAPREGCSEATGTCTYNLTGNRQVAAPPTCEMAPCTGDLGTGDWHRYDYASDNCAV